MRRLLIVSLLIALTACSPLPEGTVSQRETAAVAQMEKAGALPELDRSASFGGVDADHNGIRDDIDAWIAGQQYSEPQKKAAQQFARALQYEMVSEIKTKDEARANAEKSNKAIDCLYYVNDKSAHEILTDIIKITINTKERILKENQNNKLVSGMVFPDIYFGKNPCE